jgi:hypothetical protein
MAAKLVRVRATRALVIHDDVVIQMVPKGMTGTLTGCRATNTTTEPEFTVRFDFHAVGGTDHREKADGVKPEVAPGDFDAFVPEDAIEFVGTIEAEVSPRPKSKAAKP